MEVARTRIGKVTLKRGGSVQMLHVPASPDRASVERRIRRTLDSQGPEIAGFAFVVWDCENGSTSAMGAKTTSRIPSILAPDFVRNRLLAAQIEDWTLDTFDLRSDR